MATDRETEKLTTVILAGQNTIRLAQEAAAAGDEATAAALIDMAYEIFDLTHPSAGVSRLGGIQNV